MGLRNLVYIALGLRIYGSIFTLPEDSQVWDTWYEYSHDHLQWQFKKARIQRIVALSIATMHHFPRSSRPSEIISWIGYPRFLVPCFRDNLVSKFPMPHKTATASGYSELL